VSRLFSSRVRSLCQALGGALVCAVLTSALVAGPRGRPIEFSALTNEGFVTNASQATAKQPQDELLQQTLQEELLGSLGTFGTEGSLSGMPAGPLRPPASPPVQNQQVKELLERRKNWAFMTPDDFKNEQTLEELIQLQKYDRDGQEEVKQSPLERYYRSLDSEKLGNANRLAGSFAQSQDGRRDDMFSPPHGPAPQGNPLLHTESRLGDLFGSETDSAVLLGGSRDGFFSGFSGSAEPVSMERTPAQKARLEEFKQLLDPRLPVAPTVVLGNPFSPQPDLASPASMLGAQPHPVVRPLFGSANAEVGTRPGGLSGINVGASGPSSFAPVLPAEAPRAAPQALAIPKRKF
jgi:hypothetical protein